MCQAYEAERNLVIMLEGAATLKGFISAKMGLPKSAKPPHTLHGRDWDHGWECWHGGILPWELESKLDLYSRQAARENFERDRTLPAVLEEEIKFREQMIRAEL